MRSRIVVGLVLGAAGGFLGWLIQESLISYRAAMINGVCTALPLTSTQQVILSVCTGGIIGLFLGSMDGIVESNPYKLRLGIPLGLVAGFICGGIGMRTGGALYAALGGTMAKPINPSVFTFVQQLIARSAGLTLLGIGVGFGSSVYSLSFSRIRNGTLGGLLGGLVGGFLFNILADNLTPVSGVVGDLSCHDVGGPSRAVAFTAIGACTGFFIGLIQEMLKDAWVKVLAGRNEGNDFILARPMNLLGRDEKCEVPLFGDPSVGVQHAAIRAEGHRHVLIDGRTPTGTLVNGQQIASGAEQLLRDGDMIQIGRHRILFREKATASKYVRGPQDTVRARPPGAVPMPSHLCPYCGAPKDVNGKCLCNIDAAPAPPGFSPGPYPAAPASGALTMGGYAGTDRPVGQAPVQMVGVEGPYAGQGFTFFGPNMTVGRDEACAVCLAADSTISRKHATLVMESGTITVIDNGSSNGTFLNGVRLSAPVAITSGDVLQFASSKFRID